MCHYRVGDCAKVKFRGLRDEDWKRVRLFARFPRLNLALMWFAAENKKSSAEMCLGKFVLKDRICQLMNIRLSTILGMGRGVRQLTGGKVASLGRVWNRFSLL